MAAVHSSFMSCERRPFFFIEVSGLSKLRTNVVEPCDHRSHFGSRYHIWSMRLARPFCFEPPLALHRKCALTLFDHPDTVAILAQGTTSGQCVSQGLFVLNPLWLCIENVH